MDPLGERQTRAIEEIASTQLKMADVMEKLAVNVDLLAHPAKQIEIGKPSAKASAEDQLRQVLMQMDHFGEWLQHPPPLANEGRSVPWLVAREIREAKRQIELWQGNMGDIEKRVRQCEVAIGLRTQEKADALPGARGKAHPGPFYKRVERLCAAIEALYAYVEYHGIAGDGTSGGDLAEAMLKMLATAKRPDVGEARG